MDYRLLGVNNLKVLAQHYQDFHEPVKNTTSKLKKLQKDFQEKTKTKRLGFFLQSCKDNEEKFRDRPQENWGSQEIQKTR